MKKLTIVSTLALMLALPYASSAAMTLKDVHQLVNSLGGPQVLGASTTAGIPEKAPVLSDENIIKSLNYVKGSPMIIDGKLKKGSTGSQVEMLQFFLRGVGYPVPATGKFGPITEKYVKELQSDYGLKSDGVVGKATQNKIAEEVTAVINK